MANRNNHTLKVSSYPHWWIYFRTPIKISEHYYCFLCKTLKPVTIFSFWTFVKKVVYFICFIFLDKLILKFVWYCKKIYMVSYVSWIHCAICKLFFESVEAFLKSSIPFSTKSSSWSKNGLRNPYVASVKLLFILEKTLFSIFDVVLIREDLVIIFVSFLHVSQ